MKLLYLPAFLMALVAACDHASDQPQQTATKIGWVDDNCLVIDNTSLPAGTQVTVVIPTEVEQIVSATISGPALGSTKCAPLRDDRKSGNEKQGVGFYILDSVDPIPVGIGSVVGGGSQNSQTEPLDFDGNGTRDSFSFCTTSEGIRYDVWSGYPYQSANVWSGYYYLGYDTEADCPDA